MAVRSGWSPATRFTRWDGEAVSAALALAPPLGGQSGVIVASADRYAARTPAPLRRPRLPATERALVHRAQRGSEDAIEALFRTHWSRSWRAAYLIVHDGPAAEDIAQEAFLAAIRALDRFDRRRPFGPWLHRIVVNRAIDWVRARALRREVGAEIDDPRAPSDSGAGRYSDDVVAALRSLSPDQRAVVVMRYLLDYTPGEIAAALELPRGTVNSRLRRGLDQLGERLREEES
jgi:RNA polymerase sigma-70 factor (ECF subfamily)